MRIKLTLTCTELIATALATPSGLDPGKIVRTMNGEYTGAWRNVDKVLAWVAAVASVTDYQHSKRILTQGCPFELRFEEQESSKIQMLKRGNQKSFSQHPDAVNKISNKEDRYSHLITMHDWMCQLGPNLHHHSQGIVDLKMLIWDGSTKLTPMDIVMNHQTHTENEVEVIFGAAKNFLYW